MKTNGQLSELNVTELMNKVKEVGESFYTLREANGKYYYIDIFFEDLFGTVDEDTKYWFDVVEEDEEGNQKRLTTYEESRNLLDYEIIEKLNNFVSKITKTEKVKKEKRMSRKIRNYLSKTYYENHAETWFKEHEEEVLEYLLQETGFNSIEELREAEYHMYFGFDCGLAYLEPINSEMAREWRLDNGKYDAKFYPHGMPLNSQSTTLQQIQIDKYLYENGLSSIFNYNVWID